MDRRNEVQSTSNDDESIKDKIPSYFLVELTSLDELAFPANSTKRVKYTCVASSSRSLILGTSTGTVYVFSRYAAKSRSRTQAPVPVHVFTTRDGQVNTISVSPNEEMMAIGGDSGRVSVAQMNNGQPPTLLYSTPGDARSPDKVTTLAWAVDQKAVYSGHSSGNVHVHRLGSRSVFRASHQKLVKFDGEITQLDVHLEHIIVSTTLAAFLFHVEDSVKQQIGTKTRSTPSVLGACYIRPDGDTGYIIAARPNGRLWESNLVGHVYKTHQFRQNKHVARCVPISFRCPFITDSSQFEGIHPENQDVMFNLLKLLLVDGKTLILSASGSRICVVDADSSKVVIIVELEYEILDIATCSNDVFVLFGDSKGLRKFSLFNRIKCVEKLHLKSLFIQSAQLFQFCSPFIDFPAPLITKTIEGLAVMSKKKETERLQQSLQKMLENIEEMKKASESMYDNMEQYNKMNEMSKKLSSGIHRVLKTANESGYDDDFLFNTPQGLRERSRSSPCGVDEKEKQTSPEQPTICSPISKRASEPSNLEMKQEWRKNGTPDVVEEDILHRARQILDSDGQLMEKESLRTLLQLEGVKRDEIRFTPTVTIGNAAKALAELALAVPVDVSTIWRNGDVTPKDEKKKPTIVKVVRPGVRPRPVSVVRKVVAEDVKVEVDNNTETTTKDAIVEKEEPSSQISEEMRRKQDEMWLDLRLSHIKKQNMEAEEVKKSDTDYTLTTDESSRTPDIWTNPLDESVTPTKMEDFVLDSKSHCENCGMHRSWSALSLLISVCGRAEVIKDDFHHGGVPNKLDDWYQLLQHVASNSESPDFSTICPRCETAISGVERVLADGWKNVGVIEEGTKANVEKIYERCVNISDEKMRTIVSRSPEPPKEKEKVEEKKMEERRIRKDSQQLPLEEKVWAWCKAVKMKTLLALCCFVEGKKSTLELIKSNDKSIANQMESDDWCSLVAMSTREVYFKDLLSVKTIGEILESVGASGWVIPKKIVMKRSPTSATVSNISSWIVDTNGKCPICTLSIKMVVGGADRGVSSYCCGHVYHKMCLAGRFSVGCPACRARVRRSANLRNNQPVPKSPILSQRSSVR